MALTETEELEMLRLRKQRAMALAAQSAPAPAMPEGRIPTGVPSVDYAPEPEPAPQPSIADKVVGGVQGAMQLADHVVQGLGGMFGTAAGTLGGVIGAVQTRLTGGVQPDSDAVRAGLYRPKPYQIGGEIVRPPDAIDEAGAQGAGAVQGALRTVGGIGDAINPVAQAVNAFSTPQSQGVAEDVAQRGGEILSHDVDPYVGMALHAPAGAPANAAARGAGRVDQALNAGQAAPGAVKTGAKAVGGAAAEVAKDAVRAAVNPDPVMLATARRASEQFPDIQITPNMVAATGSTRKAIGDALDTAPGGHGAAVDLHNVKAVNNYLARLVNPEETSGRLTPSSSDGPGTLEVAERRAGAGIGDIYAKTPVPAEALEKALAPIRRAAAGDETGAGAHGNARVKSDIPKAIDQLLALNQDGVIDGSALREWSTKLGTDSRRITDPEVAGELADLRDKVTDIVKQHVADPTDATRLEEFSRQYAYAKALEPAVAATKDGLIRPGDLQNALNATRNGRSFAVKSAGPLQELARVGKIIDPTAAAAPATNSLGKTGRILAGPLKAAAGQVYNRAGPAVTRMLTPKAEAPPAAPEPAPLELAPQEPLPAGAPAPGPGPLGDLTPEWGTSPGAGAPPAAEPLDATGLHPALDEPAVTTGNRAPPSQGAPGSQIPAVPGRPDLPDTMVSGPPGETAATEAANAAMGEPGAVAAREAQSAPATPAAPTLAPKPNAAEQAKLDEIDNLIATTKSDVVRETLAKERARVLKDAAARETADKAKADAAELRTHAMTVTDKATRDALIARADKLDPPEKVPAGTATEGQPEIPGSKPPAKPLPAGTVVEGQPEIKGAAAPAKPLPVPEATEYNLSDPEWHAMYGNLGVETTERIKLARAAQDIDPAAEAAALERYAKDPEGYVKALKAIIAKGKPGENQPAPHLAGREGAQAPEAPVDQSAGKAPAR